MILNQKLIKLLLYTLIIAIFVQCNSTQNKESELEIVLRLEPSKENPRNSEGDFIKLKDGRILFIYTHFTEGSGDNSGAYLAGRYSSDKGKTWSNKDVIVLPNEGGMNIMSVSLIRLDDNRIALFYLRKNSEIDCLPVMRISEDESNTWSDVKECILDVPGYYVMNNDRVVKLSNGRIILPLALHNTPETNKWFNGKIICYYSDDVGETWKKGSEANNPKNITSQEPGIIELSDGRLMLFCRTDVGKQYISYSYDHGDTWSPLEPGNIRSPLSPASIERIPSTGDLLLVWNNNYEDGLNGGKRTPFNLAISIDEGRTWDKIKTIEYDPFGWYCYTAIEFVDDYVLLGHCAGDTKQYGGLETTQITRLNLDWVYSEATPDPFISSDKDGKVELKCKDSTAIIYYSMNGTFQNIDSCNIYNYPIEVSISTPIIMLAISEKHPVSKLVSGYVGTNIMQPANNDIGSLESGLNYKFFKGNISNTDQLEDAALINFGVIPKFSIARNNEGSNFAYTFDGIIKIPQNDLYNFYLKSNDGSVLYLNDELLIDNDGSHGAYEKIVPISLEKGLHKIFVKYFQAGGSKMLKVSWSSNNFEKIEIPPDVLFHKI